MSSATTAGYARPRVRSAVHLRSGETACVLHETGGDIDRPELVPGARVRVIKDPEWDGPWPTEPLGTIEPALPDQVFLTNDTEWGRVREYKVRFDEPARDADGQGPYRAAVIWQQYLRVADAM